MKEIFDKTLDYLQEKVDGFRSEKRGKVTMFTCPVCKTQPLSCNIIPFTHKIKCHHCNRILGNIIELVRILEPDKKELDDDLILDYLGEKFSVQIMTETEIFLYFDFYQSHGFDLVPIQRDGKIPIEKEWTTKVHTDSDEWQRWKKNDINLGVKTGKCSNLTILDVDTKTIDPELFKFLKDYKGFLQESSKGYHYFFQYERELPKTRIDKFKLDIENDGGQVVLYPSVVEGVSRKVLSKDSIPKMPVELKEFLQKHYNKCAKKEETQISIITKEDIDLDLVNEGNRTNFLMKFGGLMRKKLNLQETSYVMEIVNNRFIKPSLPSGEFNRILQSLDKYIKYDHADLASKILDYLRIVGESTARNLKDVLNEKKMIVDKALAHLVKEGYIIKGNRGLFHVIQKANWKDTFSNLDSAINFTMPYFYDQAVFNWGDMILLGSKSKWGKCFGKGTKILMNNGTLKNVEDIKRGDKVQGTNNSVRTVLEVCVGRGYLYKISPVNTDEFIVNGEHILCLQNKLNQVKYISVNDYLKKDLYFKKHWKLYADKVDWSHQKTDMDPYVYGVWLGDGHSASSRISTTNKEIVDILNDFCIKNNFKLNLIKNSDEKCPCYSIVGGFYSWLKNKNLLNNKHILNEFKINSREVRLQLLAGIIDTDGYLNTQGNYSLSFVNEKLAKDVAFVAKSLGFSAKVHKNKAAFNTIRYRFNITGNVSEIPCRISYKKSSKFSSIKNCLRTGFTVTKLNIDDYYGFTVDGDKLFLIENFIVNHNTTISMNMVKSFVDQGIKPYYISLETGSRFQKTWQRLGGVEGQFYWDFQSDPTKIELEQNAVTVIDWLMIEDKSKTDAVLKYFVEQLFKTNGILIIFMQLKENGTWFAPNMVHQFPSLAARYIYDDAIDGTDGKWLLDAIREAKFKTKMSSVPCKYNWDTKQLQRIDEIQRKEGI